MILNIILTILAKLAPLWENVAIQFLGELLSKGVTLLMKPKTMEGTKMNPLFKAVMQEGYDLFQTGEAIAGKQSFVSLLPLLIKDATDAPAVATNWSDLKTEAQALITNPAADEDLLAFATTLAGGSGSKPAAIVTASATLILSTITNVEALVAAIKM